MYKHPHDSCRLSPAPKHTNIVVEQCLSLTMFIKISTIAFKIFFSRKDDNTKRVIVIAISTQIYCFQINWIIQKTVWDDKYGKYVSFQFPFLPCNQKKKEKKKDFLLSFEKNENTKAEFWFIIYSTRDFPVRLKFGSRNKISRFCRGFSSGCRLTWERKRNKCWQNQQMEVIDSTVELTEKL